MTVPVVGILSTTTQTSGEQTIVSASGELDLTTAPALQQTLVDLIDRGRHHLVLDLLGVTFCDSAGLTSIVEAYRLIQTRYHGGYLRVVCSLPMLRILDLTGLRRVLPVYTRLAAACGPGVANDPHQAGTTPAGP